MRASSELTRERLEHVDDVVVLHVGEDDEQQLVVERTCDAQAQRLVGVLHEQRYDRAREQVEQRGEVLVGELARLRGEVDGLHDLREREQAIAVGLLHKALHAQHESAMQPLVREMLGIEVCHDSPFLGALSCVARGRPRSPWRGKSVYPTEGTAAPKTGATPLDK
jgi:hypothetical protein